MKKFIAVAGLGAAITLGSLVGAGTASANTSTFLSAVHSAGFYSNENADASLVNNGRIVCQLLDEGYSQYYVQNQAYIHTDSSIDWVDAGEFVAIAQDYLC
jgi:Protein of unknown function (DUF732)